MTERLRYPKANPGAYRAMAAMQAHVDASGLEHPLLELVKLRASYLNGCAFCVDMHTKDARAAGPRDPGPWPPTIAAAGAPPYTR